MKEKIKEAIVLIVKFLFWYFGQFSRANWIVLIVAFIVNILAMILPLPAIFGNLSYAVGQIVFSWVIVKGLAKKFFLASKEDKKE